MKKKPKAIMITGALIAAAAGALAVSGAAAQIVTQNSCDAKLVMTADRTTVTEGDEVTVTIQLTENTGFVSFLADLDYDSEILTLTDFSYTDTLSDWVAPTSYILTGSSMYWDTAYEENTATGALASMTFTVNEGTAGTVTEAGLSMESCLDYDFNQLDVEQEKAEIRIVSDADTLCVNNGKSIYYQQYAITSTIADAEMTCSYAVTPEEVLFGDWDGDGIDTICLRKGNTYYFYNDVNGQTVDSVVSYGSRTDEVLCGDWDGDGADSLCVRRDGNVYYFQQKITDNQAWKKITYGKSGDEVLCGDWNGDGADSLCLRRNGSAYYIQKSFSGTTTYSAFSFGKSSDVVLCGDWNGDGKDSLCVRRSGNCYYFQKEISDKYSYASVIYGKASSQVYAGKWISADE